MRVDLHGRGTYGVRIITYVVRPRKNVPEGTRCRVPDARSGLGRRAASASLPLDGQDPSRCPAARPNRARFDQTKRVWLARPRCGRLAVASEPNQGSVLHQGRVSSANGRSWHTECLPSPVYAGSERWAPAIRSRASGADHVVTAAPSSQPLRGVPPYWFRCEAPAAQLYVPLATFDAPPHKLERSPVALCLSPPLTLEKRSRVRGSF